MPTPRFKQRRSVEPPVQKSWKDHPLMIAVACSAATAVFFMTVVVPLRVDLLTTKLERLTELTTTAAETAQQLEVAKRDLAAARATLEITLSKSPFNAYSIYPLGLDAAVVGTSVNELVQRYPNGKWDEENSYYSVDAPIKGVVKSATHYFTGEGDKRKVNHILYLLAGGENAGVEIVYRHILGNFGEPDAVRRKIGLWKISAREWVKMDMEGTVLPGSYHVYAANHVVPRSEFPVSPN